MKRHCLRAPIPEIFQASQMLDRAVTAHFEGNTEEVAALLTASNMTVIRDWTESLWGKKSAYVPVSKDKSLGSAAAEGKTRAAARMPDAAMRSRLLRRDGFHCRFCGIPVIRSEVRTLFVKCYPDLNLWGRSNPSQHAAFQAMWVQYDHIDPHSGGGTNDIDNLVIACAPCNYGRMEHSCESVGLQDPRERGPILSDWDGLERFLPAGNRMPKIMASEGLIDRMSGKPITTVPQCHDCINWVDKLSCQAFPEGIPLGVLMNTMDHRRPIDGDHGIRYVKKPLHAPKV